MQRRTFLTTLTALSTGALLGRTPFAGAPHPILTVRGPIDPAEFGPCLPHEHVLSQFGMPPEEEPNYDPERLTEQLIPYLKYIRALGAAGIVDCTGRYFGRDPLALRMLSEKTGLHLVTNTGIYGAADDRYVPERAYRLTAAQLADEWVAEFRDGIGTTGVRPGFIKTAVDGGPLSAIDKKLVEAAVLTHAQTGLPIYVHTSDNVAAVTYQLDTLRAHGVHPSAWTWVHAQNVADPAPLLAAAERGAWISLDGIKVPYFQDGEKAGDSTLERHLDHVLAFREAGLLDHVLLSHDGSWIPPAGTPPRPYDTLFTTFIPLLRAAGLRPEEIELLTERNPAAALTVRIR